METSVISRQLSKINERHSQEQSLGSYIANELKFESLLQLLSGANDENRPAIYSSALSVLYTHKEVKNVIKNQFNLYEFNLQCNDRVGILLPNGAEFGLCILATCCYCTCVPMNSSSTIDEIKNDIKVLQIKALVIDTNIVDAEQLKATTLLLKLNRTAETFKLETISDSGAVECRVNKSALNSSEDTCLLLQTSGTTGQKKTVPYKLKTFIISTLCVAFSWRLTPTDCNLNMMPLFHVGGIVRNLFAPLLTGGSVILCEGFDPNVFWDILETTQCPATWYYAAPTIHWAILQTNKCGNFGFKSESYVYFKKWIIRISHPRMSEHQNYTGKTSISNFDFHCALPNQ
ncbi:unnamed protein product [Rotaria sp. Silwood2]|nr:unnamed protein product [Rotaria sp. Silwood2]CAF2975832.1 unnamed protein product [Rotaria sp. Silwood2]CAF4042073.1 unnamed protein product [Rotaria sp. Silwood2]CAF4375094.1 unnamed protein product [Rotaria sp. Silwood2]CAF4534714.1 unnamed protein product [Rotaria sp. Silwood2]